jgi:hypothetical protein
LMTEARHVFSTLLPAALHRRLRMAAASTGERIAAIVCRAVAAELDRMAGK